jgi:hypothetical protein
MVNQIPAMIVSNPIMLDKNFTKMEIPEFGLSFSSPNVPNPRSGPKLISAR